MLIKSFAESGSDIIFTYFNSKEKADKLIEQTGSKSIVESFPLDVRDSESVKAFFEHIREKEKYIGSLVYLAGTSEDAYIRQMKNETWQHTLDVHLTGCFNCLKNVSKIMSRQKYGRIVTLSSDAALMGVPMRANYCAAKAGIIGLTKSVARELAPFGVTVNVVAPGMINTERIQKWPEDTRKRIEQTIPLKRFGNPEEVASLIAYLCSESAGYITGQVIQIDGGLRI